ncbi:MAG TPA: sigma-54-dependent Fis family transcriptional regulator, partial [Firmicutes bacterium]|nr:sigma-54-dependent Fis family transcriptional regulator [Bacillota bacterium]
MVKKQYRLIFQAWEAFIRDGIFQGDDLEAPIARSWQRCREYALNPHAVISHQLTLAELYRRKEQSNRLNDLASVFIHDLCSMLHDPKLTIALLDRDGYILKLVGDEELQKQAPFLQVGENWREKYKGTNAIGLVLLERSAMLVQATEHYSSLYHKMASFAAPVFDLNGDILAVLAIFGYYRHTNNHTLGMAITAARAIESRLRCEYACRGKDDPSYNASAIIESMDEGIISFDTEGRITHFNSVASKMLQIPPDSLAGSRLDELMQNSDMAEMLLRKGKKIYDQEFLVESRGKRLHFLVGGRAIKNNQGDILGGVLTLRGIHHVRNLVTRMLGALARYTFEDIIGSSPAIKDTIKLAKRVAGSSVTILLQGESGTGKELFAQAMHNAGPCPKGPFVVINCGAIPKELMESELFGFEEGAFTGARRGGQPGKFELASGG